MLLTIATTARPATDLGYLLHKHPDKVQHFQQSYGVAHVFFPAAREEYCEAALLLEVDPIDLVRSKRGGPDAFELAQYVNDRPYSVSSLMSVALGRVFNTARAGTCKERPELAATPIPLVVTIPTLPCPGGPDQARAYFEPLGWHVDAQPIELQPPEWGPSTYISLRLTGTVRLADALGQLYILLPALDNAKHYWVGLAEVDKLLRAGAGWLATHPQREAITMRYLAGQRSLAGDATARLLASDDAPDHLADEPEDQGAPVEETAPVLDAATSVILTPPLPQRPSVRSDAPGVSDGTPAHDCADAAAADTTTADGSPVATKLATRGLLRRQRLDAVEQALADAGARTVVDLGCGEGALIRELAPDGRYTRLVGADVSVRALERAARSLNLEEASDAKRERIAFIQSSVTYRDARVAGFDAAVLQEVVEHLDPGRLPAATRCVFGFAHPAAVVVTTPNAEYNVHYPGLQPGALRHPDHRFEWTRAQFAAWASEVCTAYGYSVELRNVGDADPQVGPPTQLALFRKEAAPVAGTASGMDQAGAAATTAQEATR